jgi:hypothetical protein
MKKLLLLFLLIFSSQSFAEWKAVSIGKDRVFYVNFDNLRKSDGYTFYWELVNLNEAEKFGKYFYKSYKEYKQADCKLLQVRNKGKSYIYSQKFGRGNLIQEVEYDGAWLVAPPDSNLEVVLKRVCE